MTQPNPTQRDREAAARHLGYQHWADMVAWGVDGTALAEAFARHAAEVREECARVAEGWPVEAAGTEYQTSGNGSFWDEGTLYDQGRADAAAAIRESGRE